MDGGFDGGAAFGFLVEHVDAGVDFGPEGFLESLAVEVEEAAADGGSNSVQGKVILAGERGLQADLFEEFFLSPAGLAIGTVLVLENAAGLFHEPFVMDGVGALGEFPLAEFGELPVVLEMDFQLFMDEVPEVFRSGREELLAPLGFFGFGEGGLPEAF